MSPRRSESNRLPYATAVPAVRRAMAVLEAIAASPGGLTMAEVSRTARLSPSSALAILRTLEEQGYLWQEATTRRYRVGLPLLGLGRRASQALPPVAVFSQVASELAYQLGQTVSLWTLQAGEAVLAAAVEGTCQVRFAPAPGLRWPVATSAVGQALLAGMAPDDLRRWWQGAQRRLAPGSALPPLAELAERVEAVRRRGYAEEHGATEPGLYVLACPVDNTWRGAHLAVAYAAPLGASQPAAERLVDSLGQAAATLAQAMPDGEAVPGRPPVLSGSPPVWLPDAAGPMDAAELRAFLDGPWLATLSCLKPNGYPYSVPVWYQWEDERFWVVPRTRTEWARYLEQDPRVSLAIGEPHPPLRRALVEGRAESVDGAAGRARIARLVAQMARRYLGPAATGYLEATAPPPRRAFAIVPERLVTWRGLAPHPRYSGQEPTATYPSAGVANA